jgi:hypothetical protein
MNAAVEQLELIGRQRVVIPDDYQWETALKCKSRSHAFRKCVELGDFEYPKELYIPLKIDQGQWSRIWAGTAFPDPDVLFDLMHLCGNVVPVLYDVHTCGFKRPERVKSSLEAELEQTKQELEDERRVNRRLVSMLRGQ